MLSGIIRRTGVPRWGKRQTGVNIATLDELLDIEGVVAAGEFGADGSLKDYKAKMDMSPEMAQMTAQFCATVTMMFNTLANSYTQLSGMRWVPQQGWAYSGGDWTVAIGGGGHKGVFVETARGQMVLRQVPLHPPTYVMPEPQMLIPFSRKSSTRTRTAS